MEIQEMRRHVAAALWRHVYYLVAWATLAIASVACAGALDGIASILFVLVGGGFGYLAGRSLFMVFIAARGLL